MTHGGSRRACNYLETVNLTFDTHQLAFVLKILRLQNAAGKNQERFFGLLFLPQAHCCYWRADGTDAIPLGVKDKARQGATSSNWNSSMAA